eukprot:617740-Amphidinium_carterae.2
MGCYATLSPVCTACAKLCASERPTGVEAMPTSNPPAPDCIVLSQRTSSPKRLLSQTTNKLAQRDSYIATTTTSFPCPTGWPQRSAVPRFLLSTRMPTYSVRWSKPNHSNWHVSQLCPNITL